MKSECKIEETTYGYTKHHWYLDDELVLEEGYSGGRIAYRMLPTDSGSIYAQHARELDVPNWVQVRDHEGRMHSLTEPSYVFYSPEGNITQEEWHRNGLKHRDHGEPAEIHYREDGESYWRGWFQDGKQFRDPDNILPSLEFADYKSNKPAFQAWTNHDGEPHRDGDLSASISHTYNSQGEHLYTVQRWRQNGEYARDNNEPAYVKTLPDGTVIERRWYLGGRLGRVGGKPAIESYGHTGQLYSQEWWEAGVHHRADGPALVQDQGERGVYEAYYLNGVRVPDILVTAPEQVTYETVLASDKNRDVKWEMINIIGLEKFVADAPKQKLDSDDEATLWKIPMGYGWGSQNRDYRSKRVPDDWGLYPETPLVVLECNGRVIPLPEKITTLEQAWHFDHSVYYWQDSFRGFSWDDLTLMEID
jgi:hypothetical protein